ncbi:MAG: substrate-binding domain-containing protein [Solirubrobacteraceae bacterium]
MDIRITRGRVGAMLAGGGAVFAIAAVGFSGMATTASAKRATQASKYSVAFVPGATGVGFYNTMADGIKAEARKLGMGYSTEGSPDFTPSAQTPVVDAVCTRHPSILLVAPTDPVAMRPAIAKCMSEGIKVVTVDTGLTNTKGLVSAITSDNIQGGEAGGKLIAKLLHGKGQVALMSLSATATTQVERLDGARKALKAYPGIKIVATEYTQQATSSSVSTAEALLSAHPGIKAFFGAAEPNAEGTAQALHGKKGIYVVGYDGDPPEVQLVKEGKLAATILQQPALEGQLGVEYGHDALTGKTKQIKKSVKLSNVLLTTAVAKSGKDKKYYYAAG